MEPKKKYSDETTKKATQISEILGGEASEYLEIVESLSNEDLPTLIDMILSEQGYYA